MQKSPIYEIRVEGRLDAHWADWFDGLCMSEGKGNETLLKGPVADQAALRGILEKIWNLNLTLIALQRCEMRTHTTAVRK